MTKIEWTETTWNPIVGCSKASAGCANCYAERMAVRHANNPQAPAEYAKVITGGRWNGTTAMVESALEKPLHWKKPRMVFVGSMTDLFHKSTPFEWIDRVFAAMALTHHTYQVLTKRPKRMKEYVDRLYGGTDLTEARRALGLGTVSGVDLVARTMDRALPNVWLGVTAENQEQANARIPILLDTRAAVRFVSVEPMLTAVDLQPWHGMHSGPGGLDWVICGGESGPGARPMHPQWARDVRDRCAEAGVPYFMKQWGRFLPKSQMIPGVHMGEDEQPGPDNEYVPIQKHAVGYDLLDGVEHSEYPEAARG